MKEFYKIVSRDKILQRSLILSLLLTLLSVASIVLYYRSLPPFIAIFNQMPWGEQRIKESIWILIMPAIMILFLLLNIFFSKYIYKDIPLLARIFSFATFLIAILGLLFVLRTIHTAL